jgi:hypothetical protein
MAAGLADKLFGIGDIVNVLVDWVAGKRGAKTGDRLRLLRHSPENERLSWNYLSFSLCIRSYD